MRSSKTILIVAIGLVGALTLGGCASSQPASRARADDIRAAALQGTATEPQDRGAFSVSYEVSAPPTTVLAPSCDSAGQCAFPYANTTSQLTGGIVGTGVGA